MTDFDDDKSWPPHVALIVAAEADAFAAAQQLVRTVGQRHARRVLELAVSSACETGPQGRFRADLS